MFFAYCLSYKEPLALLDILYDNAFWPQESEPIRNDQTEIVEECWAESWSNALLWFYCCEGTPWWQQLL